MTLHRLILIPVLIIFFACSPLKQIKDPDKPFEREVASLLPPEGHGWRYVENDMDNVYDLHFSRQGISRTHKSSARYIELVSNTTFGNPEHFLKYVRHMKESDLDYWEHKLIKKEWTLDNRFGEYSLHYYLVLKHIDPARMSPKDYSLIKRYGYVIRHPYFDNIIIDIFYDEEGKPVEINPYFEKAALKFINGLRLKKKESD